MPITVVHVRANPTQEQRDAILYIGRECAGWPQSVLHNPFPITKTMDRDAVVAAYKQYLWHHIQAQDKIYTALQVIASYVISGMNVKLGCWCAPEACHGDIVKAAVEWMVRNANPIS